MFCDQAFDRIPAERSPADAGKYRILGHAVEFSQPAPQYHRSFITKRCCALLSALSYALHMGSGAQCDVLTANSNQFRHPQACLDCDGEKGSISTADPSRRVWGGDQGIGLFAVEELNQLALVALVWHGEHVLALQSMGGLLQGDVSKEGMDGSQPGIAGASAVASIPFEMLEKLTDEGCIKILEHKVRGSSTESFGRETQKKTEGVTVSGYGVGTCAALLQQALRKEGLEKSWKAFGDHGPTSSAFSTSRLVANWSSSGTASRYQ
jgi:hypothetical protein